MSFYFTFYFFLAVRSVEELELSGSVWWSGMCSVGLSVVLSELHHHRTGKPQNVLGGKAP